ncbi:MAG: efflux RND transporter permease subunit [Nitrospinae bacterium]|nr:efflux RND transporter permease subunit [Nitrospinota bacterium]
MLKWIIAASARNSFIVLVTAFFLAIGGYYAARTIPLDAIPDLSDVQVIIYTEFSEQSPQVVEDQITYPLSSTMLSVPGAKTVRGYSFFGASFVYVIFDDGVDLYWARSRVLEYLNSVSKKLPEGVTPILGPDATGVGWVYEYALIDKTGKRDLAQLRSIQDWFLRYELRAVKGVAEVASVGGFVKQYQAIVDPNKLMAYKIPLSRVMEAIRMSNRDVGGSVIEMAETEYMVRGFGYLKSVDDLSKVSLAVTANGTPIMLRDVAEVTVGPAIRRGLTELDGQGEAVGGIIVMRFGENALSTIDAVKKKIAAIKSGLPEGVEIVEVYDRSALILRAVDFLKDKLVEESVMVALVCVVFLMHLRSAFVAIVTLPLGILGSFIMMRWLGVNANIMSLGGIAIAIGAMIDASVVMIENAHKHLERDLGKKPRSEILLDAAVEVGPALFFSLVIITLSFIPVFALEAQEGRLFRPLAFTKTFAMASAALLSITLVPALMIYLVRGDITPEKKNPLNRLLIATVNPVVAFSLRHKITVIIASLALAALAWIPLTRIGSEFMPPLDEGDILYMPTTMPNLSITKAREILQQTDRIIKTFPEVDRVFGKAGRAETATDPAPLSMFETIIKLKPKEQWRPGVTMESLMREMDSAIKFPGLSNSWTMPIKTRIDMLSTGIKTPVGVKVAGPDLAKLEKIGAQIEGILRGVPGTRSVFAERVAAGQFLDFVIDREKAARYGLNVGEIQEVILSGIGGMSITNAVEGLERYSVNLRYGRELRDDIEKLKRILIATPGGQQIPITQVADIRLSVGPPEIRSENARPNAWVFVDIEGVDVGTYVANAKKAVETSVKLPPGATISWSGQFEYMERAKERLKLVVPLTLGIIFMLLYFNFGNVTESLLVMLTAPLSAVGGLYFIYYLGYNLSVAVGVGFIALMGVAAEIGVLMLIFIDHAMERRKKDGAWNTVDDVRAAVLEGVSERIRPKMMTSAAILGGLAPIMFGEGTGSEIMTRIAAPMVGGIISVSFLALIALPALYCLILEFRLKRGEG